MAWFAPSVAARSTTTLGSAAAGPTACDESDIAHDCGASLSGPAVVEVHPCGLVHGYLCNSGPVTFVLSISDPAAANCDRGGCYPFEHTITAETTSGMKMPYTIPQYDVSLRPCHVAPFGARRAG